MEEGLGKVVNNDEDINVLIRRAVQDVSFSEKSQGQSSKYAFSFSIKKVLTYILKYTQKS